jgi:two-component system, chemotaxis family, protein-glutamate methylesterase/glutaminase
MKIKLLLADDSDAMRAAIVSILREEPNIEIVGEASSFAETMQMIGDFKPDVLLLDLHLPEKRGFAPDFVKSQLTSVDHILAISLANDDEAKILAESYGVAALLDKMNLYNEMLPAIRRCISQNRVKRSTA